MNCVGTANATLYFPSPSNNSSDSGHLYGTFGCAFGNSGGGGTGTGHLLAQLGQTSFSGQLYDTGNNTCYSCPHSSYAPGNGQPGTAFSGQLTETEDGSVTLELEFDAPNECSFLYYNHTTGTITLTRDANQ